MQPNPRHLTLWSLLILLGLFSLTFKLYASDEKPITANVMGPLWLESEDEWQTFRNDLSWAKSAGVGAVTIDVWWGAVETDGDQKFDWRYYDKVFKEIRQYKLRIIPIMSFHQCGGNVNDTCNIPLPNWVWHHFDGFSSDDLKYKSEQGNYSSEYVSLWANHLVLSQYRQFMQAFEHRYQHLADYIDEINISMGPAGEIRFPSYNQHDTGTEFPTRGAWQVYGKLAQQDLTQFLTKRYASTTELNKHWGTSYKDFASVSVPLPTSCSASACKATIDWFHQALVTHGKQMLVTADEAFANEFKSIPLGYKVAGIHWLMAKEGRWHRAAEIATGLLPASRTEEFGYRNVISLANLPLSNKRGTILHYTALEMSDNPTAPAYSRANALVTQFSELARTLGVNIKGENALSAGVQNSHGWRNIHKHIQQQRFTGITVLRLNSIANGEGRKHFEAFIELNNGE